MRSISALVLLLSVAAAPVDGVSSGQYGFLGNRQADTAPLVEDDNVELEQQAAAPAQRRVKNWLAKAPKAVVAAAAVAMAVLGGGAKLMGPYTTPVAQQQTKPILDFAQKYGKMGAKNTSLLKSRGLQQQDFSWRVQSEWAQGWRKGTPVTREQVPSQLPQWGAPMTPVGSGQGGDGAAVQAARPVFNTPAAMAHVKSWDTLLPKSGFPGAPEPGALPGMSPDDGWQWPQTEASQPFRGYKESLIGTVVEFDMVGFGQIHCGCQTNIYLTKAPGDDQPQVCDSGGNGYGCYELDFMEGNAATIATTFHLCGDEYKGDFMCSDERCLSSVIDGKQGGGKECDAWGCQTNTKDLPEKDGKKAYGLGGYIDSNSDFKMAIFFEASADGQMLDNVWVRLTQDNRELIYKVCDAASYIHAYTNAAKSPWTTQSTYWGGGDSMEWLNGPCPDFPPSCGGNAADHIQNVKISKVEIGAVADSAPAPPPAAAAPVVTPAAVQEDVATPAAVAGGSKVLSKNEMQTCVAKGVDACYAA